jgi:outer membrane protein OmpA-like peptidoglycan-associated protein
MSSMKRVLATAGGIGILTFTLSACDNSEVVQKVAAPKDVSTQVATTPPPSPPPTVPTEAPVEPLPHYNVHFAINSAELSPMAIETLNLTVEYLRDHPAIQVKLSGFTDSLGPAEANRRLAERRVAEAAKFLEKNGIALMRVTSVAVGEGQPDSTPFGENPDTWNRRVEIEFAEPPNS